MFYAFERDGADAIMVPQCFINDKDGFEIDVFDYIHFDPNNVLSIYPMLSKGVHSMFSEGLLPTVSKEILSTGFEAKASKVKC